VSARRRRAVLALLLASSAAETTLAQRARRSVECASCIGNYFYFDQNASSGAHRDWSCASSSYDGHRGSDWSLSGGLAAIDVGHNVVAIADGTVVTVNDGAFDRCTSCPSSGMCGTSVGFGYGNYVRVDHGTRSVIYAHMRTRSVRVSVGQRVTCGQVLGQIASSGCSTGAHLHTEFRVVGGASATAYDPYEGGCSPTRPSVWTAQNAFRALPGPGCDGAQPPPMCPAGTFAIWTCNAARTARTRCINGMVMTEPCPGGCAVRPTGTDDVCNAPPAMCSPGVTAEWTCDAARAARVRCNAGVDQREDCPHGCEVLAGDDACSPAPACPQDVGAEWTCTGDGSARRRCIMGATQTEPCPEGCDPRAGDDACRAGMRDAGPPLDAASSVPRDGGARDGAARDAGGPARIDGGCGCRANVGARGVRGDRGLLGLLACGLAAGFARSAGRALRRRIRYSP
jgi:hypothetical protein